MFRVVSVIGLFCVVCLGGVNLAYGVLFPPIINPGFEEPGGGGYVLPTGWECSGVGNSYPYSYLDGQLLPEYGYYAVHTEGPGGFTQTVANYAIQPDTQYTLRVLVGGRSDSSGFGFGGSRVELFDATAGSVLASDAWNRDTLGRPDGGWVESIASFTAPTTGVPIGDILQIRLIGTSNESQQQTWFDNVRLDTTPTPEPSTFALLGMGAIGLLGWAWRRRQREAILLLVTIADTKFLLRKVRFVTSPSYDGSLLSVRPGLDGSIRIGMGQCRG
jgi:hypothetical protein